jgi:DNA polymerase-1
MRIALDIETNLAHNTIHLCVTKHLETGEVKVWKNPNGLNDYLSKATLLIAHNGIAFDFYLLNKLWNTKIGLKKVYDTLVASRLLEPTKENGHSLESYGKQLGIAKIDYPAVWSWMMDRREEYPGECYDNPIGSLLESYCTRDVVVLERAYNHISNSLNDKGFSVDSIELEHQVAAIIAQQERNGFKLDTIHATCLLTDLKTKMAGIYEQMQERWPPVTIERYSEKTGKRLKDEVVTFNPGSRQQIGEKLIELGWKPKKLTPTGQPIVDEDTLKGILFPEGQIIAEYLLLQKRIAQVESWLEAMGSDGRVHGKVITNGAVTGRATHSKPNMAQIPNTSSIYGKECRECWTVEEGNVQVGVDLSGIELRCLSHYMQDAEWQSILLEGDVHWKNTQAFGLVPMNEERTDSDEHTYKRNLSKTLCYSVLYGAGAAKVGSTVGGSAREGQKLIDNFMNNTPGLKRLSKKVLGFAAKGYVPGLDGRKVWVRSDHAALNSLLQSAGAIIAKKWIICLTEDLKAKKIPYKLLAWVHDEVQLETSKEYGDMVGKIVAQAATKAGELLKMRCPIAAEYRVGKNWYECH